MIFAHFYSDYKGWSCLHHAASEGYTQTMAILLSANLKLLDKTDEDGVKTAALSVLPQWFINRSERIHGCLLLKISADKKKKEVAITF